MESKWKILYLAVLFSFSSFNDLTLPSLIFKFNLSIILLSCDILVCANVFSFLFFSTNNSFDFCI